MAHFNMRITSTKIQAVTSLHPINIKPQQIISSLSLSALLAIVSEHVPLIRDLGTKIFDTFAKKLIE